MLCDGDETYDTQPELERHGVEPSAFGHCQRENNQELCRGCNGSPTRVETYLFYIDAKARVYDAIHLEQSHAEDNEQVIYQPLLDLIVNLPDDSRRSDK
jgi:hypothetical protein